jgi:hypothetical protein
MGDETDRDADVPTRRWGETGLLNDGQMVDNSDTTSPTTPLWAPPDPTDWTPTPARPPWPPPHVPDPPARWQWAGTLTVVNVLALLSVPSVFLFVGMGSDACAPGSVCGRSPILLLLLVVTGAAVSLRAVINLSTATEAIHRRDKALAVLGPVLLLAAYQLTAAGIDGY